MYVIAEVGSNFLSTEDCLVSVRKAREAGADAIKFQLFHSEELYGFSYDRKLVPPIAEIAAECQAQGINFMCTAFSRKGVELIDCYVAEHKIASAEMLDPEILDAVAKTKKPVYLSTGGHNLGEITQAVEILCRTNAITIMYCESAYPAYCTDFDKIDLLRDHFTLPIGISDHSKELFSIPGWARDNDLEAIEKHVQFVEGTYPDTPHSLSTEEFARMCRYLRGRQNPVVSPEEADMVTMHNRRLVATQHISEGQTLRLGWNFGSYRSLQDNAHALSPLLGDTVNGKVARRNITQGDCIIEGDF